MLYLDHEINLHETGGIWYGRDTKRIGSHLLLLWRIFWSREKDSGLFSINLITLFALVLVIGTVVDDAIVVVEAVQARFDVGYKSSYMASIDAMKGITIGLSFSRKVKNCPGKYRSNSYKPPPRAYLTVVLYTWQIFAGSGVNLNLIADFNK